MTAGPLHAVRHGDLQSMIRRRAIAERSNIAGDPARDLDRDRVRLSVHANTPWKILPHRRSVGARQHVGQLLPGAFRSATRRFTLQRVTNANHRCARRSHRDTAASRVVAWFHEFGSMRASPCYVVGLGWPSEQLQRPRARRRLVVDSSTITLLAPNTSLRISRQGLTGRW
jgi:hypothetical protein